MQRTAEEGKQRNKWTKGWIETNGKEERDKSIRGRRCEMKGRNERDRGDRTISETNPSPQTDNTPLTASHSSHTNLQETQN
jgi:hypothetical protein